MTKTIDLYVNDEEVGGQMEWSMSVEEVLGGTGRFTITVQDRTNVWEPQPHWDIKAVIGSSGWVLARGEIVTEPVELPVKFPFRKWQLTGADYNGELEQRLVGAFDGTLWMDADGLGDYVMFDPFAQSLATDKLTVQQLFDHYFRVHGEAVETDTFVGEFLTDFGPVYWTYTNLRAVLEELASFVTLNLQFWIDPDLFFHWTPVPAWQDLAQSATASLITASPGGLVRLFPEFPVGTLGLAPYAVSDAPIDDEISFESLRFEYDGQTMPEQAYVKGGTGFVFHLGTNPDGISTGITPPRVRGSYTITFTGATTIYQVVRGAIVASASYGSSGLLTYGDPITMPTGTTIAGPWYVMTVGDRAGWAVPVIATPVQWWSNAWGTPPAGAVGHVQVAAGSHRRYLLTSPASHVTTAGETLVTIAQAYYGNGSYWQVIYNANTATIGPNPAVVKVGLTLYIPRIITDYVPYSTTAFGAYVYKLASYQWPSANTQRYLGQVMAPSPKAGWWLHPIEAGTTFVRKSSAVTYNVIVAAVQTPPDPTVVVDPTTIGVGGTGWAGSPDPSATDVGSIIHYQDPNKRQAYVEAPNSTTKAEREAVGGQALYRGKYPTLRGNVVIRGHDGWRVGQLLKITDARLPTALNGRYFVIQRVGTTLIPTADVREYSIDWGDGPVGRQTQKPQPKALTPPPANQIEIEAFDLAPEPNSVQTITGQLVNQSGAPWALGGKVVNWTLLVEDASGNEVPNQGSLLPPTSLTDQAGKARTTLTTGSQLGLVYFVFADSPAF